MEPNIIQENTSSSAQPMMPKQKKQIPSWLGFVIIIVFAVVAFGGVFAYQYFFVKPAPLVVQTPQVQSQTADWKTYTDENYGISFKYPKEWGDVLPHDEGADTHVIRVAMDNNGSNCIPTLGPKCKTSPDAQVFFQKNLKLEDFVKMTIISNNSSVQMSPQNKINVGGLSAVLYTYVSPLNDVANAVTPLGYFKAMLVGIEQNGSLVELSLVSPTFNTMDEAKNYSTADFDKFISTFKFITPTSANNILYINKTEGYQIKLPANWTGYRVVNDNFMLPTTDSTWYEEDANGNKMYGYAIVFSIRTFSLDDWNKIKTSCGSPGSSNWGPGCVTESDIIAQNSTTIFTRGIPPTSGPSVGGDVQWGKLASEVCDNALCSMTNYFKNNFSIIKQ